MQRYAISRKCSKQITYDKTNAEVKRRVTPYVESESVIKAPKIDNRILLPSFTPHIDLSYILV
jgi:hypothetical protein